jgi:NAD(P)-dependent dehydrogenase (short-subunit alcohol dehydrogenase family)
MYRNLRCDPKLFDKDLTGQTIVVTGANSGVGLETTRQLVRQGAHVVMGCRRVEAGEAAAATMAEERGSTEVLALDLASLDSVRSFAGSVLEKHDKLIALVNNAGVMTTENGTTKDGFELQFGTNHLGHFLLTELLLDTLKVSAPSRIVILSSVVHAGSPKDRVSLDFDDLMWRKRTYSGTRAYAESKLANVLYAKELARRLEGTGVTAVSVHPGWVRSNLAAGMMPVWIQNVLMAPLSPLLTMMSNRDGAQTSLHCLLDDAVPDHPGAYYSQNSILYADKHCRPGAWPLRSPNPHAHDTAVAQRLVDESRALVGLT